MSRLYSFKTTQKIPANLDTVWEFISSPGNLRKITPPGMGFEILSDPGDRIFQGQLITYNIRPLFGLKMKWVSEITQVHAKKSFVDEQRSGPYSLWIHKHILLPLARGVEMKDEVQYKIPFSVLGDAANYFIVRKRLREIFNYRYLALEQIFGKYGA